MMRNAIHVAGTRRPRAAVCGLALLLGAAGCGSGQHSVVALVPAFGTVTIDGAPLPEAVVQFIPTGPTQGQGGTALTEADGKYKATTPFGEPGLPAGEYKVIISKRELPKGSEHSGPAVGRESEVLPAAYSDKLKTTLKASVPASGEAMNDFVLRSVRKAGRG